MPEAIDFEETASGILMPARPCVATQEAASEIAGKVQQGRRPLDRLSPFLNTFSVLIQLLTVFVLWMTFQRTVIPIQQKELLAEEAARLARANKLANENISRARSSLARVNEALLKQRNELSALQAQRNALQRESRLALATAASSRRAEREAVLAATSARSGLTDAQWNIFQGVASWQIARSSDYWSWMQKQINLSGDSAAKLTGEQQIALQIQLAEEAWPNYPAIVKKTTAQLRALRSAHFTPEMANQFADVFEKEARHFTCPSPDFSLIKSRYLAKLNESREKGLAQAKAEMEKIQKEFAEKGWRPSFADGWLEDTAAINETMLAIGVRSELSRELMELPRDCDKQFNNLGKAFLRQRAKTEEDPAMNGLL